MRVIGLSPDVHVIPLDLNIMLLLSVASSTFEICSVVKFPVFVSVRIAPGSSLVPLISFLLISILEMSSSTVIILSVTGTSSFPLLLIIVPSALTVNSISVAIV